MGNSDDTLAGSIDQDTKGATGTGGPSRDVDPEELATTTVDEALTGEIVERRASMEQNRKCRPWWTAFAGLVPFIFLGYLTYLLHRDECTDPSVLLAFTIGTFSLFIVIYSVILIGLYRVSPSDASQGHLLGLIRQALGKEKDPS